MTETFIATVATNSAPNKASQTIHLGRDLGETKKRGKKKNKKKNTSSAKVYKR